MRANYEEKNKHLLWIVFVYYCSVHEFYVCFKTIHILIDFWWFLLKKINYGFCESFFIRKLFVGTMNIICYCHVHNLISQITDLLFGSKGEKKVHFICIKTQANFLIFHNLFSQITICPYFSLWYEFPNFHQKLWGIFILNG